MRPSPPPPPQYRPPHPAVSQADYPPYSQTARPQYPPGYAFPMPGPKKMNPAVIIAVIAVVAFVGIIVTAAVVYVVVTGTGGPSDGHNTHPTVTLSPGTWNAIHVMIISITSVSSSTIHYAGLTYQLVSSAGTVYFNGESGSTTNVSSTTTTVFFNDEGGTGAGRVGPDDHVEIQVQGDASPLHGTTFKMLMGADVIGTTRLP